MPDCACANTILPETLARACQCTWRDEYGGELFFKHHVHGRRLQRAGRARACMLAELMHTSYSMYILHASIQPTCPLHTVSTVNCTNAAASACPHAIHMQLEAVDTGHMRQSTRASAPPHNLSRHPHPHSRTPHTHGQAHHHQDACGRRQKCGQAEAAGAHEPHGSGAAPSQQPPRPHR